MQMDFLSCQSFFLHTKQHDDVGPAHRLVKVAGQAQAGCEGCYKIRRKFRRAAECDPRPKFRQQKNAGTGNTAVINVPDNRDLKPLERFLVSEDGEPVQQGLRGMFVHPVSGVDDGYIEMARHQVRGPGGRMTDDDGIGTDGAKRVGGIEQRLALLNAGSRRLNQRGDRAQRLGGNFERSAGAGGRLVEKQDDALAAKQGPRFGGIHAAGKLEKRENLARVKMLDAKQGAACRCADGLYGQTLHDTWPESGVQGRLLVAYLRSRRPRMAPPSAPPMTKKRNITSPREKTQAPRPPGCLRDSVDRAARA